ncbi:MAG: cytochrome C biogenesis protein [Betaproteobacteria bacterium RBG_16_64_9]|nr:MAG: cytochrome C biogenesis protein [Betaproteobacteria bacterium RBG_16_64_9]OGA96615.1 MAG: cytochrome C biogenesis protein [Betaproteobacteria bacterium RIFCSPLOWO2_12_FULL_66_14]
MVILLHALTALGYAALAWHFWRTRWGSDAASAIAPWERAAILLPLALHTWLLYDVLFRAGELRFGFGVALSAMLWLTVLIYWIESLFLKLEAMQAPLLALAALSAPLPALFPGLVAPPEAQSLEFRLHTAVAMLAYSLFTMAALHALLMTVLERRLHGRAAAGSLAGPLAGLPPLLSMEILLFRLIAVGFLLLTFTLATGIAYSETLFGQAMKFNHKTLFAVISWLIFAALLGGRYFYGWRGKVALRWTLAGFLTLLLAYVGSRFVIEVVLKHPF